MFNIKSLARNTVLAGAATLLLGSAAYAQVSIQIGGGYNRVADRGFANRVVEGTVQSVAWARGGEHVRLTNGWDVVIPNSMTAFNQGRRYAASTLVPGDVVRMTVYSRPGDGRDARVVSFDILQSSSISNYGNYGNNGNGRWMNATIVSLDRRDRTMVVQTDSGRTFNVDLSNRDWDSYRGFHRGDRVSVSGRMDRGTLVINDIRAYNQ